MTEKIYLNWEDVNIHWEDVQMPWEEVIEIIEFLRRTGGGSSAYIKGNPWDIAKKQFGEEKTKKFIKIFCEVNGLQYEKIAESKMDEIKITVDQLDKVLNEAKINVKINFQ